MKSTSKMDEATSMMIIYQFQYVYVDWFVKQMCIGLGPIY